MALGSLVFLFRFIPVFMILYFAALLLPGSGRIQNVILLLGGIVFCAFGSPACAVLLLIVSVTDFSFGRLIENHRTDVEAKIFLALSVMINVILFCSFQFADRCAQLLNFEIGLFLFREIAYLADVYRGEITAEIHLFSYTECVFLFPAQSAGPVVRYRDVAKDLVKRNLDVVAIAAGCRRFITGLAKVVLLAGGLTPLWMESLEKSHGEVTALLAWLGVISFGLALYFELSGYSDMVIGLGEILGFHFPENFDHPYCAVSVTDFCRRFCSSVVNWFENYVFEPIKGKDGNASRCILAVLAVAGAVIIWLGGGVWWTLWIAFFLFLEWAGLKKILEHLPGIVRWIYTMFVIFLGCVLLVCDNSGGAALYFSDLFGSAGFADRASLYILKNYGILLVICIIAASPLSVRTGKAMDESESGAVIAVRRFAQKIIPALLLLASIAYLASGAYESVLSFLF